MTINVNFTFDLFILTLEISSENIDNMMAQYNPLGPGDAYRRHKNGNMKKYFFVKKLNLKLFKG